jgi:ribulose 1,5-bisphosphate synthetase/thiazole synthase
MSPAVFALTNRSRLLLLRNMHRCPVAILFAMVFASVTTAGDTIYQFDGNRSDVTTADVIVYGSTPGGFCSAIAAAREGASVILLEPTDHVGGLNTGGLSHCDSNQMVRSTVMGLFDEWHTRVVKDYTDRGLKPPYNPTV